MVYFPPPAPRQHIKKKRAGREETPMALGMTCARPFSWGALGETVPLEHTGYTCLLAPSGATIQPRRVYSNVRTHSGVPNIVFPKRPDHTSCGCECVWGDILWPGLSLG